MTDQLHRHQEWLRFLKMIDRHTPKNKELHLIVDNYATHKHPEVLTWLAKHPRFHMHFTPTSSSWLNLVERFFRDITHKHPPRRVHQRGGVGTSHQRVHRRAQRQTQAVHLDR